MTNQITMDKLLEMRLGAMCDAFLIQRNDTKIVFCKTKIQKVAKKNTESCTVFSTRLRHPVW
jgi:hypothetical protein